MEFILHTCLSILVLACGLAVFINVRNGTALAFFALAIISGFKDISFLIPGIFAILALVAVILQPRIQRWVTDNSKGAMFPGLAGSLVLLLFYGIFLGPISSFLAWLVTSGLQLFPQMRAHVGKFRYWGNTFFRAGLTLLTLGIGIYVVFR